MIFPTDQTIQPTTLGIEAEARGFESIWFPEHSHIPVSRVTPWGGREGAPPLPDFYARTHDQFVALGAIAAVTKTIKLGTGITLLAQRDPVWTAKAAASVDHISGGRFILGVGYGWNKEELNTHGVAYNDRRDRLRAKLSTGTRAEVEHNPDVELAGPIREALASMPEEDREILIQSLFEPGLRSFIKRREAFLLYSTP